MKTPKILFVSHDANRAGAQLFLLSILKQYQQLGIKQGLLLLDGGVLEKEFQSVAKIFRLPESVNIELPFIPAKLKNHFLAKQNADKQEKFYREINHENYELIYLNTVATSGVVNALKIFKLPFISHIHELEYSIRLYSTPDNFKTMIANSKSMIGCSEAVSHNLKINHNIEQNKIVTIHSFVDNKAILKAYSQSNPTDIRKKHKIPQNKKIVVGCGNAEFRKGVDIFADVAQKLNFGVGVETVFVWVGIKQEGEYFERIKKEISPLVENGKLILIEPTPDAQKIINASHLFLLTSREDPFPLVMLEAALAEKPILGLKNSGGVAEFVEGGAGMVVDDLEQMVEAAAHLLTNEELTSKMGSLAKEKCLNMYNFEQSFSKINQLACEMTENKTI